MSDSPKYAGHCQECVWYNMEDAFAFCDSVRAVGRDTCSRFFPEDVDQRHKSAVDGEPIVCSTCDREKDPGKCWWCGEE